MVLSYREKLLLAFLGSGSENEMLDPIRIVKGLFLFTMEAKWQNYEKLYNFVPYYYGPFSQDIYSDMDQLRQAGFLESIEIPGQQWCFHRLTPQGKEILQAIVGDFPADMIIYLKAIFAFVKSLNMHWLLKTIYIKYPKYAKNSVFRF